MANDEGAAGTTLTSPPAVDSEEFLPAGTRLNEAVRVVGSAAAPPPRSPAAPETRMPAPLVPPDAETVDLFGASATAAAGPQAAAAEPATTHQTDLIVDLRLESTPSPAPATIHTTAPSTWTDAKQGWVRNAAGGLDWRTVVTGSPGLDPWQLDVGLGVITVDVLLIGPVSGDRISRARADAVTELAAETARRGGHAAVSVSTQVAQLDNALLISATGSAVTLRRLDRAPGPQPRGTSE